MREAKMDRQEYMAWLSEIDELSADQRAEAGRALAGQPSLEGRATPEGGVGVGLSKSGSQGRFALLLASIWGMPVKKSSRTPSSISLSGPVSTILASSSFCAAEPPSFAGDTYFAPGTGTKWLLIRLFIWSSRVRL
jgi:hypothetical protein